jgi:hypothetical protein
LVKQKGHYGYCAGKLANYPNNVNEMNQKRKHNLFYSLSRDDFTLISQNRNYKNSVKEDNQWTVLPTTRRYISLSCKTPKDIPEKRAFTHTQAVVM